MAGGTSWGTQRSRRGLGCTVAILLTIAAGACRSPEPATVRSGGGQTVKPQPAPRVPATDPELSGLAHDFARTLNDRVGGRLLLMSAQDGEIETKWTSDTCDWSEPEMIDLIESVQREYRGMVTSIEGVRECGGVTRRYLLSGRSYEKYRSGEVANRDVLRYLIEASTDIGPRPLPDAPPVPDASTP